MIVQITITRNELFLIKEMMPQWKKYADAFVFMLDRCDDGTLEYLTENKDKFNILSILDSGVNESDLTTQIESNIRQKLFDEARKYSNKIICLDTDEYLDGTLSKNELNNILDNNKDIMIHLQWIQYTSKNQIRVDGPWKYNLKDRLGSYSKPVFFKNIQKHSEHLPVPEKQGIITVPHLFIAHLQWLDKKTVAIKQYFWKIQDYVLNKNFNIDVLPSTAYDASVNNFDWQYENFQFPLKIDEKIYENQNLKNNYKYNYIKDNVKKYNIPNLNDWGMNIHE